MVEAFDWACVCGARWACRAPCALPEGYVATQRRFWLMLHTGPGHAPTTPPVAGRARWAADAWAAGEDQ